MKRKKNRSSVNTRENLKLAIEMECDFPKCMIFALFCLCLSLYLSSSPPIRIQQKCYFLFCLSLVVGMTAECYWKWKWYIIVCCIISRWFFCTNTHKPADNEGEMFFPFFFSTLLLWTIHLSVWKINSYSFVFVFFLSLFFGFWHRKKNCCCGFEN